MIGFFYIFWHCSNIQWVKYLRIWCSWCSIADFSSARTGSSPVIRYLNVYSLLFSRKMFGRFILWLLIVALGWGMIFYSANLVEIFGRSNWADAHLWWTREMWVLIWFAIVVVGGLVMLGLVSFADPTDIDTGSV